MAVRRQNRSTELFSFWIVRSGDVGVGGTLAANLTSTWDAINNGIDLRTWLSQFLIPKKIPVEKPLDEPWFLAIGERAYLQNPPSDQVHGRKLPQLSLCFITNVDITGLAAKIGSPPSPPPAQMSFLCFLKTDLTPILMLE